MWWGVFFHFISSLYGFRQIKVSGLEVFFIRMLFGTYPSVFNILILRCSSVHSGVFISGCGVPLYTEVSSFQGVEIEGFHCTQRCLHFRVWSSTLYRGVLISGCWNREVSLYTEVSSFQGVGIERFHFIQRCSHFRVLE